MFNLERKIVTVYKDCKNRCWSRIYKIEMNGLPRNKPGVNCATGMLWKD